VPRFFYQSQDNNIQENTSLLGVPNDNLTIQSCGAVL